MDPNPSRAVGTVKNGSWEAERVLISVKKRFVFVANSKTASTSIEQSLGQVAEIQKSGNPAWKHMPLKTIRKEYDFLFGQEAYPFDSFFRFGVIRDPADWLMSWYRYRRGNDVEKPLPPEMTFEEFWEAGDWNIWRADGTPFDQSVRFLDDNGSPMADMIIPQRRLGDFMPQIFEAFGVQGTLPKANVSKIRKLDDPLSDDMRAKIRAHYKRDYDLIDRLYDINLRGLQKLSQVAGLR